MAGSEPSPSFRWRHFPICEQTARCRLELNLPPTAIGGIQDTGVLVSALGKEKDQLPRRRLISASDTEELGSA